MKTSSHFGFVWMLASLLATVLATTPVVAQTSVPSYDAQSKAAVDPHLHSLDEYVHSGMINVAPLGLELRQDQRALKSGAAKGLLIIGVAKGSPAANAGLRAVQETPQHVLQVIAFAGSMAFPPAIILLPVVASLPVERDGDFIIAVDGSRVGNAVDFEDDIRDVQPGEIVYLTIIRAGARQQVAVLIPPIARATEGEDSK